MDLTSSVIIATVPLLAGSGNVSVSIDNKKISGPFCTYDTTYTLGAFATGLSNPQYITVAPNGNVFVTNLGNGTISKISPSGEVSTFVSNLLIPSGIASDKDNNIYVASNNLSTNTCNV